MKSKSENNAGIWGRLKAAGNALFRASANLTWRQILDVMFADRPLSDITRPMEQNTWVYVAVSANARCIAGLKWKLVRTGDEDREVTSGPAYELLNRPAADETAEDLFEAIVGHLCEGGEAHVFDGDRENLRSGAITPKQLMVVGKRQMTPKYATDDPDTVLWWEYRPTLGGSRVIPIPPEQHAYLRLWNPYDPYRGLSPLSAARLGIRQDYRAATYNDAALGNNGSPGGLIVFPDRVSKEQGDEYLKLWNDQHQGPSNANKTRVIGGGVDYKQMSMSNVDLALIDGRRFNREEIFSAIGVPPVVCFVFDSAHYQIGDAAQEVWIHGTIEPLVKKVCGLFNVLLLPRIERGVELVIEVNSHHVVQKIEQGKFETLTKAIAAGVPYNAAVKLLNMRLDEQPWGNQSFLQSGLSTPQQIIEGVSPLPMMEQTPDEEEEPPPTPPAKPKEPPPAEEDDDAAAATRELAATLAGERRAEEAQIRRQIPRIKQRLRAHFLRQEREIGKRLRRIVKPRQTAADDEPDVESIARRVLLKLTDEQAKLRKIGRDFFSRALEDTVTTELERLGYGQSVIDKALKKIKSGRYIECLMRIKGNKIAGVEVTTQGKLQRTLVEGLRKSETVSELSQRVHAVLGGDRYRALRIARTEAGQAVSTARFVAAGAAGAQMKGWIAGRAPRPTHEQAGIKYNPRTSPIPMDEAFEVGSDRLMYPRDPGGSAGEIINCNCVMVTVRRKADKSGWTIVNAMYFNHGDTETQSEA